ncbi:MAG TPA: SDR family NAD(P)-dependent oxidoreductase [Smithella sp.]|nr:SDR family NAD(P)-dependent oxidoreductase [Smithella sp.]
MMKHAVVTGSASGFGRALALTLARRGNWKILLADINRAGMEETLAMVRKSGGNGEIFECNVTRPEDVQKMADYVFLSWKMVDLLINNAGVVSCGFVGDIPLADWKWCTDINIWGMLYGCHSFIPFMRIQGSGHIINIASSMGFTSFMELGPYNMTKAAVISLSETMRSELTANNIGVTVSCPMFFKTNLLNDMHFRDKFQTQFAHLAFENGHMTAGQVAEQTIRDYMALSLMQCAKVMVKNWGCFWRGWA